MHTHAQQLERWLGAPVVKNLSDAMRDWYGPPIAVHGVPGAVYACGGGDFIGRIKAGLEVSALERADDLLRRSERARLLLRGIQRRQSGGFADLAALQLAARTGKRRDFKFDLAINTGVLSGQASDFWQYGTSAGAAGAAAPGGTAHSATDVGAALPTLDNVAAETRHFVGAEAQCDLSAHQLMLYDRLFSVAKTMNDTNTEAVTGVPTRYQSTTVTDPDYAGGNFLCPTVDVTNGLAATAHNWTVCTYTDQGGNASTFPSFAGRASAVRHSLDLPLVTWFAPLAAGDTGVRTLTQMQCDAAVTGGGITFVIGHPIAWLPCPLGGVVCVTDGINTAFNLARVFDGACLELLEVRKATSTDAIYRGTFTLVHG